MATLWLLQRKLLNFCLSLIILLPIIESSSLIVFFFRVCFVLSHQYGSILFRFDCPVLGWGFMLIGCIPAAFVEIPNDFLEDLRQARHSLTIMCAGVWHNLVLAFFAFLSSLLLFRILFAPFVDVEHGIFVDKIAQVCSFLSSMQLRLNFENILSYFMFYYKRILFFPHFSRVHLSVESLDSSWTTGYWPSTTSPWLKFETWNRSWAKSKSGSAYQAYEYPTPKINSTALPAVPRILTPLSCVSFSRKTKD